LAAESREQNQFLCLTTFREFFQLLDFSRDDFLDALGGDGFDVSAVGEFGIRHDGGWIGIHQHHAKTFLPERFTGLRAGIIEFASLPDDDRAGTNNQDGVDVSAPGHALNGRDETRMRTGLKGQNSADASKLDVFFLIYH